LGIDFTQLKLKKHPKLPKSKLAKPEEKIKIKGEEVKNVPIHEGGRRERPGTPEVSGRAEGVSTGELAGAETEYVSPVEEKGHVGETPAKPSGEVISGVKRYEEPLAEEGIHGAAGGGYGMGTGEGGVTPAERGRPTPIGREPGAREQLSDRPTEPRKPTKVSRNYRVDTEQLAKIEQAGKKSKFKANSLSTQSLSHQEDWPRQICKRPSL
jgi:hypothetical protein